MGTSLAHRARCEGSVTANVFEFVRVFVKEFVFEFMRVFE
ncbi:hypothetical protein HMPREF3190_01296 [Umbribacter vaginalis]|nr:hypothetical protein HMPREF3190_01296 [Coriobacteriales bacterium DNF00809]